MAMKFKPKFAGRGVQIDGAPVDSPEGKGLMNRKPDQDTTVASQSTSDMVSHNLLSNLGDDLDENDAISTVDKSGVDKKPQGVKVPTPAKPSDGFTKKLSHNHQNSIAEDIAAMMDGNSGQPNEEGEGPLTMEELFESYLDDEEDAEDISHDGFAGHCGDAGYEIPEPGDTQSLMGSHEGYMFTPVGNGMYRKEVVPQEVGDSDIPGAPGADIAGGETAVQIVDNHNTPGSPQDIASGMQGNPYDVSPTEESAEGSNSHPEAGASTGEEKRVDHNGGETSGPGFTSQSVTKSTVDYSDGTGMEVARSGGKAVTESSVTTAQIADAPTTTPNIKKKSVKKAGNAATAVKGMTNHGDSLKRKIKNDDNMAESVKLPANVAANVQRIMEHVSAQLAKFPNGRKLTPSYRAVVDLNGKQGYTTRTNVLAEAATDAEELAVIGKSNVLMEVTLSEGKNQRGMFVVEMPKLANRQPTVVAEGMLFRFPSIARQYAATIIGESVVHSVTSHAFGAIIKGDVSKLIAKR